MRRSAILAAALVCAGSFPARAENAPLEAPPLQTNNILSLSLAQDFGLQAGTNVCAMQNQIAGGFACFRASGTQYHGAPRPGSAGDIEALPQLATTRILGGYDRVFGENVTLGVRLGWVLRGGGPRPDGAEGPSFLPFHGEARVGYTFGRAPFAREGWRFSLFADAGVAQVDTAYRVTVIEDPSRPPPAGQLDNPPMQELAVYRKAGTGFFGGGAALTCAISRRFGVSLGAKVMRMLPSGGTVLSMELGGVMTF